jgi:transposase
MQTQMGLLSAEKGLKARELAEILRKSEATVLRWLNRYMVEGAEGLRDVPRVDQSSTVTDMYRAGLVEAVVRAAAGRAVRLYLSAYSP